MPVPRFSAWCRQQGAHKGARVRAEVLQQLRELLCHRLPCLGIGLAEQGMQINGGTPEEFGAFIASESTRWTALAKAAGVKME